MTPPLVVLTPSLTAVTSTASCRPPIASFGSTCTTWSALTLTSWLYFLKPCIVTSTRYWPGSTTGKTNSPFASVTTSRVKPVFTFVRVTVAPGRTAPLVSATVPRTSPTVFCAHAGALTTISSAGISTASHAARRPLLTSLMGPHSSSRDGLGRAGRRSDRPPRPQGK